MAVAAVNTIVEDVVAVTELDRLLHEFVRPGDVRRPSKDHRRQNAAGGEDQHASETHL
jgi:hypothetical protein